MPKYTPDMFPPPPLSVQCTAPDGEPVKVMAYTNSQIADERYARVQWDPQRKAWVPDDRFTKWIKVKGQWCLKSMPARVRRVHGASLGPCAKCGEPIPREKRSDAKYCSKVCQQRARTRTCNDAVAADIDGRLHDQMSMILNTDLPAIRNALDALEQRFDDLSVGQREIEGRLDGLDNILRAVLTSVFRRL